MLPCDRPGGGQDRSCLDRIEERLIGGALEMIDAEALTDPENYSLAVQADLLSYLAPESGADVAAEFLRYYFNGGGQDLTFDFNHLDQM